MKTEDSLLNPTFLTSLCPCLQQQGSAAAAEMEVERLKLDCMQYMQMLQKWKKMYDNLHELCVNEILEGDK